MPRRGACDDTSDFGVGVGARPKKGEEKKRGAGASFALPGKHGGVKVEVRDGWLLVQGDSTLSVRAIDERTIYVKPVGYTDTWIPTFAPRRPVGNIVIWDRPARRKAVRR